MATSSTRRHAGERLDSLTGLRFVAALLVFAYHVGGVGNLEGNGITAPGRAGVSFFFILSGFLLAWTARPADGALDFYRRRWARIYPAYALAVMLVLASTVVVGGSLTGLDAVPFTLMQSWIPNRSVYFAASPVFWSLSTEAFFYLLFPWLIGPVRRIPEWARLTLIGSLVLLIIMVGLVSSVSDNEALSSYLSYIFPPTRLLEFLLGMALAVQFARGRSPHVSLSLAAALALAGLGLGLVLPSSFSIAATTVVPFALLIWAAACADVNGLGSIFRHRLVVTLGVWSYCFYLLHLRVIELVGAVAREAGVDVDHMSVVSATVLIAAMLVLSIVAAGVLSHWVERPLELRLRPRTRSGAR